MYSSKVAKRYAKSLYDLAEERGETEKCLEDMDALYNLCDESRDFANLVKSPIINPEKKEAIFHEVLKGRISELSMAFIDLMTRKGREKYLKGIASAYRDLYNQKHNIRVLHLSTAAPLSDAEQKKIVDSVQHQLGASGLEVITKIDPELIGGFVVEVDDKLVDASIRRDLNDIRKQFEKNTYESTLR